MKKRRRKQRRLLKNKKRWFCQYNTHTERKRKEKKREDEWKRKDPDGPPYANRLPVGKVRAVADIISISPPRCCALRFYSPQPENKKKRRRISFLFCCSYREDGGGGISSSPIEEKTPRMRGEILRRRSTISAWNVNIPSFRINKKKSKNVFIGKRSWQF